MWEQVLFGGSFVVKGMLKMVKGQRKCPTEEATMTSLHRLHPAVSFASL